MFDKILVMKVDAIFRVYPWRFMLAKTQLVTGLVLVTLSCGQHVFANNVAVSNVNLTSPAGGTVQVAFDITWENSWRTAVNHDACWVFVKYSTDAGSTWGHATLSGTGTNPAGYVTGSITNLNLIVPADQKGCFIQRSVGGSGSVSSTNMQFVWNFNADSVSASRSVRVQVFAVEMVFVPEGSFKLGSGGDEVGHFYQYTDGSQTTNTYTVSSTNAITTGMGNGNLWGTGGTEGDDAVSPADPDDIPAGFPEGYSAFYCMKYELSQRQYCDFLNTLTAFQQNSRHDAALNFNDTRNHIKKTSSSPAFFGCDAGNDAGAATDADPAQLNESDDGEWVACDFVSWVDACAYADWAALRPMTELEFEKACRGNQSSVSNEYAWGSTNLEAAASSLNNEDTALETPNQGNCNYDPCSPSGPYRCGCYADGTSTRQEAGASYYGIFELSGSLLELTVTVGNTEGRAFTGVHGDGALTLSGNANVTDWPGLSGGEVTGGEGAGYRGGCWYYDATYARVSDRDSAAHTSISRSSRKGIRCVRSAPSP